MELEVTFFGQFREIAGNRKESIELEDGSTLADLISRLVEMHGNALREKIDRAQGLRILINGRDSDLLDGMETRLKPGDAIVFLPPVAGG